MLEILKDLEKIISKCRIYQGLGKIFCKHPRFQYFSFLKISPPFLIYQPRRTLSTFKVLKVFSVFFFCLFIFLLFFWILYVTSIAFNYLPFYYVSQQRHSHISVENSHPLSIAYHTICTLLCHTFAHSVVGFKNSFSLCQSLLIKYLQLITIIIL